MTTTLLCLPFAGAGSSFYRPWARLAGPELRVLPLQLPGRERLIDEPPYRSVGEAVAGLLTQLPPDLARVALFGHSLGAILAYELALRLVPSDLEVVRLHVSGSPAPARRRAGRATGLPDDEFLTTVREFAGYSEEAMQDPELLELVLPALRADVQMHEDYRPSTSDPLPVPVTALRGAADGLVSAADAAGWAEVTSKDFDAVELPGGHMYVVEQAEAVLRLVSAGVR